MDFDVVSDKHAENFHLDISWMETILMKWVPTKIENYNEFLQRKTTFTRKRKRIVSNIYENIENKSKFYIHSVISYRHINVPLT